MSRIETAGASLAGKYVASARYFESGDFVEYARDDRPSVYRRIDEFLTIVLDLHTREPIGFRIKGFKNFFMNHLEARCRVLDQEFVALVSIIEIAATNAGKVVFPNDVAKSAYKEAYKIAHNDRVELRELPVAA